MISGARTLVIMAVLLVLALAGAAWGWAALTSPFPKRVPAPLCTNTRVDAGDHLYASQITVSVLNASQRLGLASRTLAALSLDGFSIGDTANAPKGTDVSTVQIWTDDPASPAVALLKSHLPGVTVVRRSENEPGIVVVVGSRFRKVIAGPRAIAVTRPTTVCSPTLS